jgi:hypothetical protein
MGKEYNDADDGELPLPKPKGSLKPKLNDDHKVYLKNFVDDNPSSNADDMMEALCDSFDGLTVSKTSLYRFLKEECAISFKLVRKESVERNSVVKIQQRFEYVTQVMESDVDYLSNCVFIDEAAFNVNMKRSGGWASRGQTPVVKVPFTRAENRTILGAVCYHGVVQLSLRKPKAPFQNKRRKVDDHNSNSRTGTVTGHHKQFLFDLMTCLDEHPILKMPMWLWIMLVSIRIPVLAE